MRDPKRIDKIIEILRAIWKSCPDLRLGQLILNVSKEDRDLYNMEDDILVEALKQLYFKKPENP